MDIESKIDIKNYKEFRKFSVNSRYDNGTNSYFKYYTYEHLCKLNYITDEQFNQFEKKLNSIKRERKNKIFTKQKKFDFIDKYLINNM